MLRDLGVSSDRSPGRQNFAEFTERGAKIVYALDNKSSNVREFGIKDLDGHDIGFGQPL